MKKSTEKLDYRQFYVFYLRFLLMAEEGGESSNMPQGEPEKYVF